MTETRVPHGPLVPTWSHAPRDLEISSRRTARPSRGAARQKRSCRPRAPPSHSRYQGARRLTLRSRVSGVSLLIPVYRCIYIAIRCMHLHCHPMHASTLSSDACIYIVIPMHLHCQLPGRPVRASSQVGPSVPAPGRPSSHSRFPYSRVIGYRSQEIHGSMRFFSVRKK